MSSHPRSRRRWHELQVTRPQASVGLRLPTPGRASRLRSTTWNGRAPRSQQRERCCHSVAYAHTRFDWTLADRESSGQPDAHRPGLNPSGSQSTGSIRSPSRGRDEPDIFRAQPSRRLVSGGPRARRARIDPTRVGGHSRLSRRARRGKTKRGTVSGPPFESCRHIRSGHGPSELYPAHSPSGDSPCALGSAS